MNNHAALAEANKALLQRHFDAINSWNFDDMRQYLHADIVLQLPFVVDPFPSEVSGFDAVMKFMESVPEFAEEENLHGFTISTLAEDPNELVAEYVSDMKLKNGNEYKNTYVVRATVRDGKLVLFREYFDGINFERHPDPVLSPTEDYERYGAEDPRVTEIDGTYYMTYTGWDRTNAQLCLATSTDLFTWTKHGPMFPDFNTFLPQGNGVDGPWSRYESR